MGRERSGVGDGYFAGAVFLFGNLVFSQKKAYYHFLP